MSDCTKVAERIKKRRKLNEAIFVLMALHQIKASDQPSLIEFINDVADLALSQEGPKS
jgi:hypothetical protein